MKVYLDDERPTPEGWVGVRWPDQDIQLLQTGEVTHISLDHDLGDDRRGTGYDVLTWLEEAVFDRRIKLPAVVIHTANPSARQRMMLALRAIQKRDLK